MQSSTEAFCAKAEQMQGTFTAVLELLGGATTSAASGTSSVDVFPLPGFGVVEWSLKKVMECRGTFGVWLVGFWGLVADIFGFIDATWIVKVLIGFGPFCG